MKFRTRMFMALSSIGLISVGVGSLRSADPCIIDCAEMACWVRTVAYDDDDDGEPDRWEWEDCLGTQDDLFEPVPTCRISSQDVDVWCYATCVGGNDCQATEDTYYLYECTCSPFCTAAGQSIPVTDTQEANSCLNCVPHPTLTNPITARECVHII